MLSLAVVMSADIAVLCVVFWVAVEAIALSGHYAGRMSFFQLCAVLPFLYVFYWMFDVHPEVSVSPIEEIKRITLANSVAFLCIFAGLSVYPAPVLLYLIALAGCAAASLAILVGRYLTRFLGSRFEWWGHPVVILGGGEAAFSVLRKLQRHPEMGMRPIAVASLRSVQHEIAGVPVCSYSQLNKLKISGVRHALVAAPELSKMEFEEVLDRGGDIFPHLLIIPDHDFFWKSGSQTRDFLGLTGLSVRNNLLLPGSRIAKRLIDLVFCFFIALILVPLTTFISALIILDSGRPIFFSQKRIGRNGKTFHIWKFRTMVKNAEEVRKAYVAQSAELAKEWAETQKLKRDPRITRVGKILRKTSLDELPQFWNILMGEMSLVGPRPIVGEEVAMYKQAYPLYAKTTPGLTGLWQVSGRNQTTYKERVAHDAFYVRNWSVWLDIHVLARTVVVVLTGYGAY
jgi:Undecaprenyl-phosphate galactose phosphotransferase WbaP